MLYKLVAPKIHSKNKQTFKRGEIIYHEGDEPTNLYFIESGLIGLFHISETGKETFFRVFGENDILGHRSFFAEEPHHASTIALMPTSLVLISKDECQRICSETPSLLKELTKKMAQDLGMAELRMAGLLDKTANKRIVESLVFLKLKYPDYTWTRKEIAEYSGSTYETVTRGMSVLHKKGFLEKEGRDFQIPNYEKVLNLEDSELH